MNRHGYTLLEILGVLAIVGLLAATAATTVRTLNSSGSARADTLTFRTIASDLSALAAQPNFDGMIPITATVGSVPVTGTNLSLVSPAVIQSGACFENVLLAYGVISTPYRFAFGSRRGFEPVPLLYSPTQHSFYTPGDVTPVPGPMASAGRVLTVLATPGVIPSAARGSNFYLTPKQDLPAGSIVFFVFYPQLDAKPAYALATAMNSPSAVLPAAGVVLNDGPVVYAAANAANKTDVFVFLSAK